MAVDPRYIHQRQRKLQLHEFHHHSRLLLTVGEQDELHAILKEYQAQRQVERLVQRLCRLLDTPAKLDMMKDIRNFIPTNHLAVFDHLTPYHRMAHPLPVAAGHASLNRSFEKHNSVSRRRHDASLYNRQPHYGSLGRLAHLLDRTEDEPDQASVYGTTGRRYKKERKQDSSSPSVWRKPASGIVEEPGHEIAPLQTIMLNREVNDNLGFSIRGGSQHGLGVYISEVEQGTIADAVGLRVGDRIVEVNSVSFESIASSSAVKVLTGSSRLKIIVRRIGKIPVFRAARQKTSWFDTSLNYIVEGNFEEQGTYQNPVGLSFLDGVIERRIHLSISKRNQHLGFNIRGGGEYGLGIYVSKVDSGGVAELKGLRAGDQIISVNGESLEGVTHAVAAHTLRSRPELILTVKDMGKYPAYKEVYAEYSWLDAGTGHTSSSHCYRRQMFALPSTAIQSAYDLQSSAANLVTTVDAQIEPRPSSSGLGRHASFTQYPRETSFNSSSPTTDGEGDYDELDDASNHGNGDDDLDISAEVMDALNEGRDGASVHHPEEDNQEFYDGVREESPERSEMLLPSNHDVVMMERLPEAQRGTTKKKDKVPRSTIGVMALQVESMPADMKDIKLSEIAQHKKIESLRKPGDINPRQVKNNDASKKSRTFRERLFGTKARADKVKDGDSDMPALTFTKKKKERKPLFNIVPDGSHSKKVGKSKSDDAIFTQGIGSQLMLKSTTQRQVNVQVIEARIKAILNADEADAVFRYLQKYDAEDLKVRDLMKPLEAILDTAEKKVLLQNIRDIIRPADLAYYDKLKHHQEADVYDDFVSCAVPESSSEETAERMSMRLSSSTPNISKYLLSYNEDSDIVAALPQRHVQPNNNHRNSIQEGISGLRRQSRPSVPEVVLPKSPNEAYSYEIHGPKSTSKVYKARMSISGETTGREVTQNGPEMANIRDETGANIESSVARKSVSSKPESCSPELLRYTIDNDGGKIDNSSTSDYYSGRSSEASHGLKDLDVEATPIYETVDSLTSTPKQVRHREVRGQRSRTPDSQSASLATLDFLDTLDDTSSINGMGSVRSLESSRASSPIAGSYDINPPVFCAPPPPDDSPPISCQEPRTGDAWQEWVDEEITMATTATETSPTSSSRGSLISSVYDRYDVSINSRMSVISSDSPSSYNLVMDNSQDKFDHRQDSRSGTRSSPAKSANDEEVVDFRLNSLQNGRLRSASKKRSSMEDFSRDFHVSDNFSRHRPTADIGVCEAEPVFVMEDDAQREAPSAGFARIHVNNDSDNNYKNVSIVTLSDSDPVKEDNVSSTFEHLHLSMQPHELNNMESSTTSPHGNIRHTYESRDNDDDRLLDHVIALSNVDDDGRRTSSSNERLHSAPAHLVSYSQQHYSHAYAEPSSDKHAHEAGMPTNHRDIMASTPTKTVILKKHRRALGMSISGGLDSRSQPLIKVKEIIPGGAAEEAGTLQPGMEILSVDGQDLLYATHNQAVTVIRRSYMDKSCPDMELVVRGD